MDICRLKECNRPVAAKELCSTHYKRLQRHGHTNSTISTIRTSQHPLAERYYWFRRTNTLCNEWLDFEVFLDAIGEVKDGWCIRRLDKTVPLGPFNVIIKKTVPSGDKAKYAREWRKLNPEKSKNSDLKRRFKINIDEYERMQKEQNGRCALCSTECVSGMNLAVDHCHSSGKIRGLLCCKCNRGLGLFKDSPELLEAAATYLRISRG